MVSRFTLRLSPEVIEKLKYQAHNMGISVNALIINILWEWLKKE